MKTDKNTPTDITTDQAAAIIGIDPRSVRAAIEAGKIEARLFGKQYIISRESAVAYANGRKKMPGRR